LSNNLIREFLTDRRGTIAIVFGLAFVPFVAFAGSAIDYGRALSAKTRLQSVVDIAAQAGARLPATANANRETAARKSFVANMLGAQFASPVTPNIDASNSGVVVSAVTTVPTVIMGVVGINEIEINARAAARSQIQNGGVACLLALNETSIDGLHMQGVNKVSSPDCWAWVNSTATTSINATGAASGVAQGFCTAGHVDGAEHFSPRPFTGCDRMEDPFKQQINDQWVPSTCSHTDLQLKSGSYTLQPGVYCGDTVFKPHADVTLMPGLYVMRGGYFQVQAGASVKGDGVTLFFYGPDTRMEVRGGGSLDLKAPAIGDLAGFVIVDRKIDWYDSSIRETVIQGGGRIKIEGIVYTPQWKVNISGNGEINQKAEFFTMIADSFYFEGNGKLNITSNAAAAGLPDLMPKIKNGPVLLQ
jgi:Putative Flp pilus-assembly TadE/G-like